MSSSIRSLTFTSLWLLLMCSAATAQQRISGSVINKGTAAPVPAATVRLESNLLASAVATATDADGRFSFASLSPGSYTVSVSADTYYPQQMALTLGPRATQQLYFELEPLAAIKGEVTVSTRSKLLDQTEAATVTNLDRNQIEMLPTARRTQLSEIITPFVSSAVAGHDNLVHLRGNELSLNTFINGVSFYDNPHQLFTPGLSPDIIQSVNVVTGGFPAEFGNRFGGILDIVTRSGFDANGHGSVTIGASTFLRNNVSFDYGGHTQRFGYFFYGQGFESSRFLNTPEPNLFHDKGYGARSFAQFDYRAGARDSFRAALTIDGTNFQLPNTTQDAFRNRDFFQRNREQTAVLSWDHTFSESSTISTSFYERFAGARLLPTSDPFSIQADGLRNDLTFGAKTDYSLFIGSRHVIKAGVDLMVLSLREDFFFDPRDNEVEIEPFNFRGRRTGVQGSAYFQDKIQVTKNFTAHLGLRYDNYSLVTNEQALSPRINLAYAMQGGRTILHFAYNRFFAPPAIENLLLSARLGFQGLPPEIAHSNFFESGVSHTIRDRLVLRLTGFSRSDKNAFETTELANVRIFVPTSFARGRAYGIESSLQLSEIKRLGVSGYVSYTAQRVFLTGPISGGFADEEVEPGERNPAAFDQIQTAVAGVTYRERRSGFFATTQLEYGSGTPAALHDSAGEGTLVRLPDHFVANFYFGIDLPFREKKKISLQINVENATNRVFGIAKESEFTPVQYSPPRFISGSVRVHF
jgi:hypothetical protein